MDIHFFKEDILKVHALHNLTMYNHVYQRLEDKQNRKVDCSRTLLKLYMNVLYIVFTLIALTLVWQMCVRVRAFNT